jgi:uncharacterized protein YdhG (YjbR/CyaY superfamily)
LTKSVIKTVDEYIASQPPKTRPVLQCVRRAILRGMPNAVEGIAYQMPAYALEGRRLLYFAGWKAHYAVYPLSTPMNATFEDELSRYVCSKGTIRFPLDGPVPEALIERLAAFRAAEPYGR